MDEIIPWKEWIEYIVHVGSQDGGN
jgi:hypothetical protein